MKLEFFLSESQERGLNFACAQCNANRQAEHDALQAQAKSVHDSAQLNVAEKARTAFDPEPFIEESAEEYARRIILGAFDNYDTQRAEALKAEKFAQFDAMSPDEKAKVLAQFPDAK